MSADLPFLKAYDGQSTDELIALAGEYRIDSIVLAFEAALDEKEDPSDAERVILAVEAIEREVGNGGFSQFFINSSLRMAPYIVDAFKSIGCPQTAALCEQAVSLLGVSDLHDEDAVEEAGYAIDDDEGIAEQFNALDDNYYEGAEEPLAGKLFEFIKVHRDEIRPDTARRIRLV